MEYEVLYELLNKYYKTHSFDENILKNYSTDAIYKLKTIPLNYLKDKYSIELLSRFLDPYFLESKFFYQDLSAIVLNHDNQSLNFFLPLMLIEKAILENKYKISNKDHIYDTMIMQKCTDKNIARHIYSVGVNGPSLNSSYHEEDMEIIASYKDPNLAEMATIILCSKDSLQSQYHQTDFQIYKQYETQFIKAYDLINVIIAKESLDSFYHLIDLNILAQNDNDEIGAVLSLVATNKESLNSSDHLAHMKKVMQCKSEQEAIEVYESLVKKPKTLQKVLN